MGKGLSAMIFSIVLSLPLLANGQCDNTLPDGTLCGEGDYDQVADPESCWKYYECDSGCVTQMTCPDDEKFDIKYSWCTFPHDVECGDRPCNDDSKATMFDLAFGGCNFPGSTQCGGRPVCDEC